MKRPQGYKTIKCPCCGEKIRLFFRTMHRMKIEVEAYEAGPKPVGKGDHRG